MTIWFSVIGVIAFAVGFLLPSVKRWIDSQTELNKRKTRGY